MLVNNRPDLVIDKTLDIFASLYVIIDAQPTLETITKLRIVGKICDKYQALGVRLGMKLSKIRSYYQRSCMDSEATCNSILDDWVNKGGHPPHYPLSWKGLYDLLVDIGHKKTGDDMMRDI